MSCYFFLSYARASDRGYAKRFFDNLSQAIRDKKGLEPSESVGFFDERNIELGKDWQREIITTLQKCRTMVCLYAPAYFKSSYCGKEWEIFDRRRRSFLREKPAERDGNVAEDKPGEGEKGSIESERSSEEEDQSLPPVIKPVVWIPTKDQDIPAVVSRIQYTSGHPGDTYNRQGLQFMLMHYNNYQLEYDLFVDQLAENILETIERYNLPELPKDEALPLSDVPNPFFSGERSSLRRTIGGFARPTQPFFEKVGKRKNKRVAVLVLVALLSVALVAVMTLWVTDSATNRNAKPVLDSSDVTDDLDDRKLRWAPGDVDWRVENIKGSRGWRIAGDRIGLINIQSNNPFNIYQDFTLSFNVRFINGRGVGWVVRAKDFDNYYLFVLCTTGVDDRGKRLDFYICKDGKLSFRDTKPVAANIDQEFGSVDIITEVIRNRFTHTVQVNSDDVPKPLLIGDFQDQDDSFKYGGVGFRQINGAEVLLQQLLIKPTKEAK